MAWAKREGGSATGPLVGTTMLGLRELAAMVTSLAQVCQYLAYWACIWGTPSTAQCAQGCSCSPGAPKSIRLSEQLGGDISVEHFILHLFLSSLLPYPRHCPPARTW